MKERRYIEYKGYEIEITEFGFLVNDIEFATEEEAMAWIDGDTSSEPIVVFPKNRETYAVTYVPPHGRRSYTQYVTAWNSADAVNQVLEIIPQGSRIVDVN